MSPHYDATRDGSELAKIGRAATALEVALESGECERDLMMRIYDIQRAAHDALGGHFADGLTVSINYICKDFDYQWSEKGAYMDTPASLAQDILDDADRLLQTLDGDDMTHHEHALLLATLETMFDMLKSPKYKPTYDQQKADVFDDYDR